MPNYAKTFVINVELHAAESGDPAVYLATNEELGLVVEAATLDELTTKIREVALDLFELNVLPKLESRAAQIPPAFIIHHALGSGRGGLLS